ncbi:hypothetical protein EZ449_04380 [Pedobacter frigidisoli]|uniref:DUF7033 domain-containing protein n=1 Tax=Pedobacter frigidisoli TaxID=2530455 RepID=A0A4R0P6J7_9SPHI|nr:hypothetical protein [Pedobacter frigidisoli]TCD11506.1 hypothetical protein EZ449_04380 [Pedobacter frigidisoli]
MHLIIFSKLLTPRIKYIFNFIFKDILKAEVEFTGNSQYFLQSENVKVSYGDAPLADELFFKNSSLLLSNKLEDISPKTTTFGEYSVPFPVKDSLLPFDVFAASFFIVSRYEEYIHQKKNEDDFRFSKSYQHKWKVLDRPIIDEWALILKSIIKKKHLNFKFPEKTFTHQPTINLSAVPHAPDGFINRTKFAFSTVFSKENNYISSKIDRLTGMAVDNESVLDEVNKMLANKKIKPIYFIDFPNVPLDYLSSNGISRALVDQSVGLLRPCASSKEKAGQIREGILKIKKIHPEQVNLISQQLEVLKFPICYLNLIGAGITSDYSMGYADHAGFRAGTCTPFNWYDLQLEKVTPLIINSYCLTDHLFEHKPIEAARKTLKHYINAVKVVNGSFYSSWRLRSLSTHLKYKKLKTIFNEMLNDAGN